MKTITKDSTMTLEEFLKTRPQAVSKVKFAEMLGAEKVSAGMGVIYFEWQRTPKSPK